MVNIGKQGDYLFGSLSGLLSPQKRSFDIMRVPGYVSYKEPIKYDIL